MKGGESITMIQFPSDVKESLLEDMARTQKSYVAIVLPRYFSWDGSTGCPWMGSEIWNKTN
ncbi:hypothetical protein [Ammoniphilus sp. 3BR4]|uniref:hypothetical protein n=1 Tax=Ammoniphilus sp. 3BR4 TaxID=3158265 RepID=UPI0034677B6B